MFTISTSHYGFDDSFNWCITVGDLDLDSKIFIRKCSQEKRLLQQFVLNGDGTFELASLPGACLRSVGLGLTLKACESPTLESEIFNINGNIESTLPGYFSQQKHGNTYHVGVDTDKRFSRLKLFKESSFNDSLDTWTLNCGVPPKVPGKVFTIESTSSRFSNDYSWCATVEDTVLGSKVYMRKCNEDNKHLQRFVFNGAGHLQLVNLPDACIRSYGLQLLLDLCDATATDHEIFTINDNVESTLPGYFSMQKNGKTYQIGFDTQWRLSILASIEDSLQSWEMKYA